MRRRERADVVDGIFDDDPVGTRQLSQQGKKAWGGVRHVGTAVTRRSPHHASPGLLCLATSSYGSRAAPAAAAIWAGRRGEAG